MNDPVALLLIVVLGGGIFSLLSLARLKIRIARQVLYRSPEWRRLIRSGWRTARVRGAVAIMHRVEP